MCGSSDLQVAATRSKPWSRSEEDDDGRHDERHHEPERLAHDRNDARGGRVVLVDAGGGGADDPGRVADSDENLRRRLTGEGREGGMW